MRLGQVFKEKIQIEYVINLLGLECESTIIRITKINNIYYFLLKCVFILFLNFDLPTQFLWKRS